MSQTTEFALYVAAFLEGIGITPEDVVRALAALVLALVVHLMRGMVARRLTRALARSHADAAYQAIGRPVRNAVSLGGLTLAAAIALPSSLYLILVFASVLTLAVARVAAATGVWIASVMSPTARLMPWIARTPLVVYPAAAMVIIELWGVNVATLVGAVGVLGIAGALVAQEALRDAVAGAALTADKVFRAGDWIEVEGIGEGVVERISPRSLRLRMFDTRVVIIPNRVLAEKAIANISQTSARRIRLNLGLTYDSSTDLLRKVCAALLAHIEASEDVLHGSAYSNRVFVASFADSAVVIALQVFVSAQSSWNDYLAAQQRLVLASKDIVEGLGGAFAFPTQTIHLSANEVAQHTSVPSVPSVTAH